ncbi:MAG: hypothetical protein AAB922_07820 [Patescibacteria group bacterium]
MSDVYVVATSSPQTLKLPRGGYKPVGNGQCVALLQNNGFKGFKGNARDWKKYINSDIGWIGSAVLLDEGKYQHLALVIGTEGGYNLVEQNYLGEYIVSYRTIPFDYPLIVGFISR